MEIPLLDNEFMEYWLKLSSPEKESLLTIAKHFVELKDDNDAISLEQYNNEINDAMNEMNKGAFITHDQVAKISQSRGNDKRLLTLH